MLCVSGGVPRRTCAFRRPLISRALSGAPVHTATPYEAGVTLKPVSNERASPDGKCLADHLDGEYELNLGVEMDADFVCPH